MSERWIYRVQDVEGRWPWRPGFSQRWISKDSTQPIPPAVQEEFPDFPDIVRRAHDRCLYIGCGARGTAGLNTWFLPDELERLKGIGFLLVRCHAVKILAESANQVLFGSQRPLHFLPRVNWPEVAPERSAA